MSTSTLTAIPTDTPPSEVPPQAVVLSEPITTTNQPTEPSTNTTSTILPKPVVCIQAPKANNIIVTAVQPFQLANTVPSTTNVCQNILLGNNAKQLIIQKPPKIGTILTMIENKVEVNGGNLLNQNQRFVVASVPKVSGNRLPVTATTNVVQPKFAFMPVNPLNGKGKVFNVKIADGQMQNDNNSITVMQDNLKGEVRKESEGLICEEVIDLDSPNNKDEDKSYQLSIIEESSSPKPDVIEITVPENAGKKFQKHGISILKRSFTFPEQKIEKPSSLIISPILPNCAVSEVTTKEVKPSPVLNSETAVKTERRRKSNVSYRKDYDEIRVSDWGAKKERFENANITFTELGENDCSEEPNDKKKTAPEDMIEIKVVKEKPDVDIKDDFDVESVLQWEEGIGSLPGSKVKFQMNEFGFLEFMTDEEYRNIIAKRTANSKQKKPNKDETQDEVRCKNCGCFGLPSDFISPSYCSNDCQETSNKISREKEAKIKRKKKRPLTKRDSFTDNIKTEFEIISDEENNTSNENSQDKFSYPWTCTKKGFSWAKYLDHIKAKSAPEKLFKDPFPYNRNGFRPGMKLEGIDPQHPSYFCVLTVAEVIGYRLRLHFDGYPENYDFWINSDSMDIFPAGWCEKYGHVLHPPPDYSIESFNWNTYLRLTRSTMAPKHLFANRAGNVSI